MTASGTRSEIPVVRGDSALDATRGLRIQPCPLETTAFLPAVGILSDRHGTVHPRSGPRAHFGVRSQCGVAMRRLRDRVSVARASDRAPIYSVARTSTPSTLLAGDRDSGPGDFPTAGEEIFGGYRRPAFGWGGFGGRGYWGYNRGWGFFGSGFGWRTWGFGLGWPYWGGFWGPGWTIGWSPWWYSPYWYAPWSVYDYFPDYGYNGYDNPTSYDPNASYDDNSPTGYLNTGGDNPEALHFNINDSGSGETGLDQNNSNQYRSDPDSKTSQPQSAPESFSSFASAAAAPGLGPSNLEHGRSVGSRIETSSDSRSSSQSRHPYDFPSCKLALSRRQSSVARYRFTPRYVHLDRKSSLSDRGAALKLSQLLTAPNQLTLLRMSFVPFHRDQPGRRPLPMGTDYCLSWRE